MTTGHRLSRHTEPQEVVAELRGVTVQRGERTLVSDLDLDVRRGEFLAVLGPNGSGKTTLLQVLLGSLAPTSGTVTVDGRPPGHRATHIGYIPQQKGFDPSLTMRGRDLVRLGVDGTRFGPGWPSSARRHRERIESSLAALGALDLADVAMGRMSGGQQQRVRAAQAVASDPCLMLCDEPLLSLDLPGQRAVATALQARRREHGTGIVFVTHEINPVLPLVDRVLYLVDGQHRIGRPEEVLTSEVLSELFGTPVEVLQVKGQLVVVGDNQHLCVEPGAHDHFHLHEEG